LKLAYAYIPQSTVERVAAELSEAGITHRDTIADIPYFERPAVSSTIKALFSSMKEGASEFFAQTAAQWLALQFLVSTSSSVETSLNSQTLTDARIERVLEYMEAKLSEPLSLDALAREAGVSKFHFIGLFRRALGTTPHKHLLTLRRELAASMLLEGSRSVLDIGLACGFQSPSHFAAIFKQAYGESPSSYRVRRLTPQFSNQIN
jgi:AraC family transcriptional regulator